MSQFLIKNRVGALAGLFSLFFTLLVWPAAGQESSGPETKPRARRIAELPEPKASPLSQPAEPATSPDDPYQELREQIAEAKTPAEKTRLRIELADQMIAAGMESEANTELRALVAEDRFDPITFYNLGNRLVRLDDIDSAVSAYRKAIDQRKGNYSRALNNLGAVLVKAGRWDEAYDALSSALRLEKFRYAEASFNLGRLYAVRGETDLAVREWQRALAVNPQHAGAARALANAKLDGRIKVNPDAKIERPHTTNAGTKSAPPAAPPARALTVDPDTFALLQKARSARERGRDEEAVGYYHTVLSHSGGYFAPANLELSYSLITLKRNDEAIAVLLAVSSNDGARFPICYYHLARLYEVRGELKLAEENYGRAVTAYSGSSLQFVLDLSRVREKLGDLSGALSALEQYIQAAQKAGRKPDWADERLADLRKKIAATSAVPGQP